MKISKDWWLATGTVEILVGIIGIISRLNSDAMSGSLMLGAIQIIFGIALFQKSKIVFWLGFIMSGYNLLQIINGIAKGTIGSTDGYVLAVLLVGVRFAFYVMLFQQIKKLEAKK